MHRIVEPVAIAGAAFLGATAATAAAMLVFVLTDTLHAQAGAGTNPPPTRHYTEA